MRRWKRPITLLNGSALLSGPRHSMPPTMWSSPDPAPASPRPRSAGSSWGRPTRRGRSSSVCAWDSREDTLTRSTLLLLLAASAAGAADTIYVNANVITVDGSKPYAEAFAVDNGRFTAVGTNAEIRRLATPETKVIDLKGMTVTPGFNDAHLHPAGVYDEDSPYYTPWLGPEKVHNMDDLIVALKKKAGATKAGELVSGSSYDDKKLGRHPNRHDLDKASTEHPIVISHASGHIIVVNSYVLQASGVTKETKDPPGGSLDREPDGAPNGVIRESARSLLARSTAGDGEQRVP